MKIRKKALLAVGSVCLIAIAGLAVGTYFSQTRVNQFSVLSQHDGEIVDPNDGGGHQGGGSDQNNNGTHDVTTREVYDPDIATNLSAGDVVPKAPYVETSDMRQNSIAFVEVYVPRIQEGDIAGGLDYYDLLINFDNVGGKEPTDTANTRIEVRNSVNLPIAATGDGWPFSGEDTLYMGTTDNGQTPTNDANRMNVPDSLVSYTVTDSEDVEHQNKTTDLDGNWTLIGTDTDTTGDQQYSVYVFAYNYVLAPEERTPYLFTYFKIPYATDITGIPGGSILIASNMYIGEGDLEVSSEKISENTLLAAAKSLDYLNDDATSTGGALAVKYSADSANTVYILKHNLENNSATRSELAQGDVTLDAGPYVLTNGSCEPGVTVSVEGFELSEGDDYLVTYENNTAVGEGRVIVTGIGFYSGTVTTPFEITQ